MKINLRSLESFNGKFWLIEKSEYKIRIGSSSRDIRLTGKFNISKEKRLLYNQRVLQLINQLSFLF